jgi:hypothetical protein
MQRWRISVAGSRVMPLLPDVLTSGPPREYTRAIQHWSALVHLLATPNALCGFLVYAVFFRSLCACAAVLDVSKHGPNNIRRR